MILSRKKKNETKDQDNRKNFMTDEEMRMIDDYLTKIEQNRSNMSDCYTEWEVNQESYSGDQPIVNNRPNSRINIINANIEGQVASLTDQTISIVCRGEGPSDQSFARWAQIGIDWTLRKNKIKKLIERHERRRELFGAAWIKLFWDKDAIDGFGLVKLACPPLTAIFVDMKINDPMLIEDAEYIAEVMLKSKPWAIETYGDVAENIITGGSDRSPVFQKEKTTDDDNAFWLIQLWTKTDGKLRLIEFSDDGTLLYDSFKEWDGKRFREIKDPPPFYRKNKYPYFFTIMYPEEGKLYGFGDGKLLRPLQDMLNDFYDQIRRAARPNRIFFDPNSEVELEDLDEDDGPVPCQDPNNNIRVVEVGRVNPALWQLVANIHQEVQRVTRFSELMMGQRTANKTATEATIQQQQGYSALDQKKLILEETLVSVCEYILDLMIENYRGGKMFRIDEKKEDYEWIDFRQLDQIPVLIPTDSAYHQEYKTSNPGMETPRWMQLMDEDGKGVVKSVELDIEINVGAGLPKNKAFLYRMFAELSRIAINNNPVISWEEFRKFIKDFLGLPLDDKPPLDMMAPQQIPSPLPQQAMIPQQQPLQNPLAEGLTANNAPRLGLLPGREAM